MSDCDYVGFADLIDEFGNNTDDTREEPQMYQNDNLSAEKSDYMANEIQDINNLLFGDVEKLKHNNVGNINRQGHNNTHNGNDFAVGHRQRAKERFLASPNTISDVDLLELILFLLIPRADTKPIAKKLLNKFKTYKGIMMAKEEEITESGISGKNVKYLFILLKEFYVRYFSQNLQNDGMEISNVDLLVQYCQGIFCDKQEEEFHVLFLNNQLKLLSDRQFGVNNLSNVVLDAKAIVQTALDLHAKNIVLTHNHPTASCEPSPDDIRCTEAIKNIMQTLDIAVIDHIIIAYNQYFSFTEHHLI